MFVDILETPCTEEGKIKEYFGNKFEAAFICLFPFIECAKIPVSRFGTDDAPTNLEIFRNCKPVKWSEIVSKLALKSIGELDIGLRTCIHGLKKELCDEVLADKICALESQSIIEPWEGEVSPFIAFPFLNFLKAKGYGTVLCTNEFSAQIQKLPVGDILQDKTEIDFIQNIETEDEKILLSTHWDSHFSVLLSSEKLVREFISAYNIEGFFCDENTEIYWSLHNEIN